MSAVRETILALSSAPPQSDGPAAAGGPPRAILRLSGPASTRLGAGVFHARERLDGVRGWRRIGGSVSWSGRTFSACAYVMRAPHSYTREDVVEIHLPGLRWLVDELLDVLLREGARLAQPGEFTRRALENGRIGLEQAEAVGALIQARSAVEARAQAARLGSYGALRRAAVKGRIEELLSLVELGLDFATEDVTVLTREQMLERAQALHRDCVAQAGGMEATDSRMQTAGLCRILLSGPVNAGKSTLFNALLGRDEAIISPRRHTTRDTLEARLEFDGRAALLIDSAGAGEDLLSDAPREFLRQSAWNATLNAIRCADVVLLLVDASMPAASLNDLRILLPVLQQARPAALALVWTKQDAASEGTPPLPEELCGAPAFALSARTGAGMSALREFLSLQLQALGSRPCDAALEALAVTRHAARCAAEALARAVEALRLGHGEDVVAVELREAVHAFWQAEGVLIRHDAVTEAALDRIFSSFCIGK